MKFIDYMSMKPFYTIAETCELFEMAKQDLKAKCEQHGINPTRNEIGEAGFTTYDMRRLHNKLYYEDRNHQKEWDPWN